VEIDHVDPETVALGEASHNYPGVDYTPGYEELETSEIQETAENIKDGICSFFIVIAALLVVVLPSPADAIVGGALAVIGLLCMALWLNDRAVENSGARGSQDRGPSSGWGSGSR
jgi:hypothetical protein